MSVVPNGIDVRAVRADAASTPSIENGDGRPLYGVVGHLRFRKGVDILLRAATRIQREMPDAHAAVVGTGEDDAALRAIRDEIGATSVEFTGPRPDARAIMSRFDVFVIPSRAEGLPIALLEAMALERPVVATTVGGIPDVLEDDVDALLVPPDDPEALASAIMKVLRDPHLARRLGIAARAKVEGRYSSDSTAEAYLEIYERVFRGGRSR